MEKIKSIIIFLLFVSFIEQLVPNKKYLPYVKLVAGSILILMVFQCFQIKISDSVQFIQEKNIEQNEDASVFQKKANDTYQKQLEKIKKARRKNEKK